LSGGFSKEVERSKMQQNFRLSGHFYLFIFYSCIQPFLLYGFFQGCTGVIASCLPVTFNNLISIF